MEEARLAFSAIDRIAVTVGPGTFTGVRVGVAAARGLALGSARSMVGATSLAVMALQAQQMLASRRGERELVVAVEAGRGSIYLQIFPALGDPFGPIVLTADDAGRHIGPQSVIVVGSASELIANAINTAGGQAEAAAPSLQPNARSLAALAADLAPVSSLRPLYLRPPDVKPQAERALPRAAP
jgi:tRNA threonylcarbamoyl adenosine modification protein YeaZ